MMKIKPRKYPRTFLLILMTKTYLYSKKKYTTTILLLFKKKKKG